jgi:hydroxylamine reductase
MASPQVRIKPTGNAKDLGAFRRTIVVTASPTYRICVDFARDGRNVSAACLESSSHRRSRVPSILRANHIGRLDGFPEGAIGAPQHRMLEGWTHRIDTQILRYRATDLRSCFARFRSNVTRLTMHMFCFQCQETSAGRGCTFGGHCGKNEETANFQDLLIFVLKGIALVAERLRAASVPPSKELGEFLYESLFMTITNTNFDTDRIGDAVARGLEFKRALLVELAARDLAKDLPEQATWDELDRTRHVTKAYQAGILLTEDVDVRSLRETVTYGLKGIAAYAHHAAILGVYNPELTDFVVRALCTTVSETNLDRLFELALETGKYNLAAMDQLDRIHAMTYGVPEPRPIPIGVRNRPAILVSGHDLVDLLELLEQTEGTGIDVYTHGEMIAGHYYPRLFAYEHLVANYGNSWWRQDVEFTSFNGPILMTSNCIIPLEPAYSHRIYTTGVAGYPGVPQIEARLPNGQKDFSPIIAQAKNCAPPTAIDEGSRPGGFNHVPLFAQVDKLLELVKQGALRRVVVMAGCDGRDLARAYYKEVAERLPKDTLILTAGCAKYVFWKLPLGEIAGIPRVLDAGQCNDCFSLIDFAGKLAALLGVADINDLPISYQVCWYDQKAVAVYLTLLHLGVRNIRLGPSLPAFFSPRIMARLQRDYGTKTIGTSQQDVAAMMTGN